MDTGALRPAEIAPREPGAVRAALRYVRATPDLWIPLALMAAVGTLGFNFQAILPLLAKFTFDGGAGAYAALVCAMGVGAVAGALATGARGRVSPGLLAGAAIGFGGLALLAAGRADDGARAGGAGAARRRQRHPRGLDQLRAPARLRPGDARAGDGALLDRLPRLDADRRARSPAGSRRRSTRAPRW